LPAFVFILGQATKCHHYILPAPGWGLAMT